MLWLLLGLFVLVVLASWVTWTAMRIDRLDARLEGAWQSLDAQLVRRATALEEIAGDDPAVRVLTTQALAEQDRVARAASENLVGAAIAQLDDDERTERLHTACTQVRIARTFYNDAVRAYAALRAQRLPRMLRLGASRQIPAYFDIDDRPGTG